MAADLENIKVRLDVERGWDVEGGPNVEEGLNIEEGSNIEEGQTCMGDEEDHCQGLLAG
jgi:hypothetical protein